MPRVRRRVVITGAGVVSPIGAGVGAFWDALAAGRSGAAMVDHRGRRATSAPSPSSRARTPASASASATPAAWTAAAGWPRWPPHGRWRTRATWASTPSASASRSAASTAAPTRCWRPTARCSSAAPTASGPLAIPMSLANHPCAAAARALAPARPLGRSGHRLRGGLRRHRHRPVGPARGPRRRDGGRGRRRAAVAAGDRRLHQGRRAHRRASARPSRPRAPSTSAATDS